METGWVSIVGEDQYAHVIEIAKNQETVLVDGYRSITTHVEYDDATGQGRYKYFQLSDRLHGGTVAEFPHPKD